MRSKSAELIHRALELLTSASVGFAAGRIFQRAHDEGRISAANKFGLDAFRHAQTRRTEENNHVEGA